MKAAVVILVALVVGAAVAKPPPQEPKLECSLGCMSGDACPMHPSAKCQVDCWLNKEPRVPKKDRKIDCLERWYLPDGELVACEMFFL